MIWIRINDPRSLGSWCIKGGDESTQPRSLGFSLDWGGVFPFPPAFAPPSIEGKTLGTRLECSTSKDSSVPLMLHVSCDLGINPKECTINGVFLFNQHTPSVWLDRPYHMLGLLKFSTMAAGALCVVACEIGIFQLQTH